jgi:hypothetical protein
MGGAADVRAVWDDMLDNVSSLRGVGRVRGKRLAEG